MTARCGFGEIDLVGLPPIKNDEIIGGIGDLDIRRKCSKEKGAHQPGSGISLAAAIKDQAIATV